MGTVAWGEPSDAFTRDVHGTRWFAEPFGFHCSPVTTRTNAGKQMSIEQKLPLGYCQIMYT
jgi:hypothetical protein